MRCRLWALGCTAGVIPNVWDGRALQQMRCMPAQLSQSRLSARISYHHAVHGPTAAALKYRRLTTGAALWEVLGGQLLLLLTCGV